MGMSSVAGIAKNYCATLRSNRTKKLSLSAIVSQLVIPLAVAIADICLCVELPENAVGTIVTGVSIVAALLCAVATLLFQVRVSLRDRIISGEDAFIVESDLELVDELFSALLWAIFVGFVVVLILVVISWCDVIDGGPAVVLRVISGVVAGSIVHFAMVIGTVLKRLQRVYEIVAIGKR